MFPNLIFYYAVSGILFQKFYGYRIAFRKKSGFQNVFRNISGFQIVYRNISSFPSDVSEIFSHMFRKLWTSFWFLKCVLKSFRFSEHDLFPEPFFRIILFPLRKPDIFRTTFRKPEIFWNKFMNLLNVIKLLAWFENLSEVFL